MKKLYISYIVIVLLIIIITTSTLFAYINKIQKLTNQNTLNDLNEITKQDVLKIENIAYEHTRILQTIINEIEIKNLKDIESIFEVYKRNSGNNQFSRLGIMFDNGIAITSDEQTVDLSNEIEEFFNTDEVKISQTRQSKVDSKLINIYSKTTYIGEEKVVILLVIETKKFEETFINSIYNGNGNEYIINSSGKIIAKSNNQIDDDKNIFNLIINHIDKKDNNLKKIEKIKTDLSDKKNGESILYKNIQKYFIIYQKLNINDWYLVIETQGSMVAGELNQVIRIVFVISLIIILTITAFSVYIILATERKKERLYNLAYIDPVTNLGNLNYFNEFGQSIIDEEINKEKFIFTIDIDKFKSFNKKYGHKIGDKLLYVIGERLRLLFDKNDIVCRISNDIYGIVSTNVDDIHKKSKNIINSLSKIIIDDKEYTIFIYIGIYQIISKKYNILECFDKALIAHSNVKGNLQQQYRIYDIELEKKIEIQHEIELRMQEALKNNEFKIVYQPKVDVKNEKMIAGEALVRWIRGNKIISPGEFIPIFEKNRFIINLDKYIFENVCKDLCEWKKRYKSIPIISINISKENFSKEDFIEEYIKIAQNYNINQNEIELEITESATISEHVDLIKVMKNIKSAGFKIAIDDFGTGTSTLSMLQNMPIDTIKIDKSFVDKINLNNKKGNIIEYIIYISKKLNLITVAEGVETKEQKEYLKSIGCDLIQGYFYSKPIDKFMFEEWMKK